MQFAVADHPLADGRTDRSPLVQALSGTRPDRLPIWFPPGPGGSAAIGEADAAAMDPSRMAERVLEPVRRLGVDAAVLDLDLLAPLRLAGIRIAHDPVRGPVVVEPVRSASDVLALRPIDPVALAPVISGVGLAVAELGRTPLIALAAAPYTLACHLVAGGPSPDQHSARVLMYRDPRSWAALLNWCADVTGRFLRAQVIAGASAVQLVDDAVGSLSRNDYFKRALPHTQRALSQLRGLEVPIVLAGGGNGEVLDLMARAGSDAVGVDRRIPLDVAAERVGPGAVLQGNLDPALLAAPWHVLEAHVHDVVERGRAARAHVLHPGASLPPDIDPDLLRRLVELVHALP